MKQPNVRLCPGFAFLARGERKAVSVLVEYKKILQF